MEKFKKSEIKDLEVFLESMNSRVVQSSKNPNKLIIPRYGLNYLKLKRENKIHNSPIYVVNNVKYYIQMIEHDLYAVRDLGDNNIKRVTLSTKELDMIKDLKNIKKSEVKKVIDSIEKRKMGGFGL